MKPQTDPAQRASLAGAVRFLSLWMLVPTLLRLAALALLIPQFDRLANALVAGGWVMLAALPQDLFIAVEALLVVLLLRVLLSRLLPQRQLLLLCVLATILFGVIQVYLLFDFLLYVKTGIRMNPAFLDFLPAASSFFSSAWEMGLGGLGVGLAALLVWLRRVFHSFHRTAALLRFSWWWSLALPAAALLAVLGKNCMPAQMAYGMDNRLLDDQWQAARAWVAPVPQLGAAEEAATLRLLRPKAERWETVSPAYPLLKRTLGFTGEKQFDIAVGPDECPHVIFLFMESFRAADVGVLGGKYPVSPNFDRLAKEGVLFTNFYSGGIQTTRAVIGALFGIVPCLSEKSPQGGNVRVPLIGVADVLNRRGYRSGYISGTSLRLESQQEFFTNHGYADVLGDSDLARAYPQAKRTSWGYHDQYLMDYAADWLAEQDQKHQPAFLTLFTISHHHPWHLPDDYPAPTFDTGGNQEYGRFLRTFHYADHCLGQFVDRLRQTGLDRRTILFVFGDHGAPQGEHHGNFMNVNYLYDENVHIPLMILAPGRLAKPVVIHDPGSQLDLLPTVMDLCGLTGLNHAVGTSLVRRVKDRTVYFNNPFALQYCGLRQGANRYVLTLQGNESALYDMLGDPQERCNRAAEEPELCQRYATSVRFINQLFLKLYLRQGFVDPAIP
jgi:phosphoglycerol transferase MdoB-like AlkP superfamily enzyme